jgi:pentose-5-phosphate-3-epimerase
MINNSEADWFHIDIMDGGFRTILWNASSEAINRHAKNN